MNELKITRHLTPEVIEQINSDPKVLRITSDDEDDEGELVIEGGRCYIRSCPELLKIKFIMCDVQIEMDNAECKTDKTQHEDEHSHKELVHRIHQYKKKLESIKEQLHIKSEELGNASKSKRKPINVAKLDEALDEYMEINNRLLQLRAFLKQCQINKVILETKINERTKIYAYLKKHTQGDIIQNYSTRIKKMRSELNNENEQMANALKVYRQERAKMSSIAAHINTDTHGLFSRLFRNYQPSKDE